MLIGPKSFFGTALVHAVFPPSVLYIGQAAFYGTKLQSIDFPGFSHLMRVEENAFGCTFLDHRIWKRALPRSAWVAQYAFATSCILSGELDSNNPMLALTRRRPGLYSYW